MLSGQNHATWYCLCLGSIKRVQSRVCRSVVRLLQIKGSANVTLAQWRPSFCHGRRNVWADFSDFPSPPAAYGTAHPCALHSPPALTNTFSTSWWTKEISLE